MNRWLMERPIMKFLLAYPLAAGALPVLLLMLANTAEADWQVAVAPLMLGILLSAALFASLLLLLREPHRAAMAAFTCVLLIFSFGYVVQPIAEFEIIREKYVIRIMMALFAICAIGLVFLLWRRCPNLKWFTSSVGLLVLIMFLSCSVQLAALQLLDVAATDAANRNDNLAANTASMGQRPDIYYIILDGYSRNDVLRDVYSFDNSGFASELSQRGFFVAEKSYSNYPMTFLSLASSLNMTYVNDYAVDARSRSPIYNLLRDHKVGRRLQASGYRYVHFNSGYGGTDHSSIADVQLPELLPEFQHVLLKTTILYPICKRWQKHLGIGEMARSGDSIRYYFDKLQEVPLDEGPTFTFAHIVCPHPPYFFQKDGRLLAEPVDGWQKRDAYLAQLQFANRAVLKTIDSIIKGSKQPPIIIVQADHGSASLLYDEKPAAPSKRAIWERMGILNAYFGPEKFTAALRHDTSPVNTFRILFASLFGDRGETLANRHYFSWYDRPYDFVEVSEILRSREAHY